VDLTDFEPGMLKQIIEKHEHTTQGLELFRGSSLEVTNMRIEPALVLADIVVRLEPGAQPETQYDREYHDQFFWAHSTKQKGAFLGIEHMTRDEFFRVFWKGQLVDCFINSETEGLMRHRAERLARACTLIEEEGGQVSYLAVTKKLIDLHLKDLGTDPGQTEGPAQDAFAGGMQGH